MEAQILNGLSRLFGINRAYSENPYENFDVKNFFSELDLSANEELDYNLQLGKPKESSAKENMEHVDSETCTPWKDLANENGVCEQKIPSGEKLGAGKDHSEASTHTTPSPLKKNKHKMISTSLLDEMIEVLLLNGDVTFSLNVAELLYERIKLDESEFLYPHACLYYLHKLNLLLLDLIHKIFNKDNRGQSIDSSGRLHIIGRKDAQHVVIYAPQYANREGSIILEQIREGDFIQLSCSLSEVPVKKFAPFESDEENGTSSSSAESNNSDGPFPRSLIGYVRKLTKEDKIKLFLLLKPQEATMLAKTSYPWKITKLGNKGDYDKQAAALKVFCSKACVSKVLQQVMFAPPILPRDIIRELCSSKIAGAPAAENCASEISLNIHQREALKTAVQQTLSIIQGPPRSGKSVVASEIALNLIFNKKFEKIVVCCKDDASARFFYTRMEKPPIRAIAIYSRDHREIWEVNQQLRKDYPRGSLPLNSEFGPHEVKFSILREMLYKSNIICTTYESVVSLNLKFVSFDCIIVDDAHLLTEIFILTLIVKNCHQLVLLGDDKLLSPKVDNMLARSKGLAVSVIEKLAQKGAEPMFLPTVYNMHPSLILLNSKLFYADKLRVGCGNIAAEQIQGFVWPNKQMNLALIDVRGKEEFMGSSFFNAM